MRNIDKLKVEKSQGKPTKAAKDEDAEEGESQGQGGKEDK